MSDLSSSHIIITDLVEEEMKAVYERFQPSRVVLIYDRDEKENRGEDFKGDFKIENAREAIREAYIAESSTKYIVLAGKTFNPDSQNALLKVLEEPPRNIEFIIIAESKSALLPTVRSRMPLIVRKNKKEALVLELSLKKLELSTMFAFIKTYERTSKHEAKELIEALYNKAIEEEILLNTRQLESFETAYKLLGLNARLTSVLSMILMKFIKKN